MYIDWLGGVWGNSDFVAYYYRISGRDYLDTSDMGLTGSIWASIQSQIISRLIDQITVLVATNVSSSSSSSGTKTDHYSMGRSYSFGDICFSLGDGTVRTYRSYSWHESEDDGFIYRDFSWSSRTTVGYEDVFRDPIDIGIELGNAYGYGHTWSNLSYSGSDSVLME